MFYEKLVEIQDRCKQTIERVADPTAHPEAITALAQVNAIVQAQRTIALLESVVTELQASKIQSSQWIDAKGVYFTQLIDGTTVHTYNASGEIFIPAEPCRPASSNPSNPSNPKSSVPSFKRVKGIAQIEIPVGATFIGVSVRSGEVYSSNGDGSLKSGDAISWSSDRGLSAISFIGVDDDTEYTIALLQPEVLSIDEPIQNPSDEPQLPMTSELIPSPELATPQP